MLPFYSASLASYNENIDHKIQGQSVSVIYITTAKQPPSVTESYCITYIISLEHGATQLHS